MNKNIIKLAYFVCAVCIVYGMLASCSGCSRDKEVVVPPTSNHEDSVRVFDQTKQFMELLKSGSIDAAIDMLYMVKSNDTAYQIPDSLREIYKKQFTLYPVKDYEVKTSDFSKANVQMVTYRYRFMDNPAKDPNYPVYLDLSVGMEYHQGKWRLMLNRQHIIP